MKENLSNLVKDSRLEKLGLSLKAPNMFSILQITKTEIRHSNFLAWLLSPKESHNLGSLFLKWFLREVLSSDIIEWANEFSIDSIDLNSVEIVREWKHIDILIVHHKFVIAIENKVYSGEHSNQLKRYKEKIHETFKSKNKGFVFLTPDGINPKDEENVKDYVPIGFDIIRSRIEIILDVYNESLSDRVKTYIEDYLLIINREIMKNHSSIELAKELYKNHKDAIDFIIEHKPDRITDIKDLIEETIQSKGYVLQTCNKYYARFLTNKLVDIIPKTGINGWKGNEGFLFEVAYWEKGLTIKFVISPGNENNREILRKCIEKLPKSKKPTGKKWLTIYSDPRKVNFLNEKYEDEKEVIQLINKLLDDNADRIEKVEELIIAHSKSFE